MNAPFPVDAFLLNIAASALAVVVVLAVTFTVAQRQGRHSLIDVTWGVGFALIAVVSAALGTAHGDVLRGWLLAVLTAVWGLRLAWHLGQRSRGAGEDPRYERLLAGPPARRAWRAVGLVYLPQGALMLLISMPIQVAAYTSGPVGWLAVLGTGLWIWGFTFESVADAQLARFKAEPANRGQIMDRGLWSWTRHPNYFGDACVWWGLFLIAAESWPGVVTVFAPMVMTYLLTRGSGKRLLEQRMRDRPGWDDYVRRTSGFVPMPPRRN